MVQSALDWLYPSKCALCERLDPASPCAACVGEFVPTEPPFVAREPGLIAYHSVIYLYQSRGADAVQRLKYERRTSLVAWMADRMRERFDAMGETPDAVVPVPIHWSRRGQRGFNQSELLSRQLPNVRPDILVRIRATRPQVGLSREERLQNLDGAFRAGKVEGLSILLVDDVLTSGGTANACARTLREAGAREVGFLGFCGETPE